MPRFVGCNENAPGDYNASMRFVLLQHDMPVDSDRDSHLDLMLESGDALRTWSIAAFPSGESVELAEELPDHRLAYLDYEGPVSNNRGEVSQVDCGEHEVQSATDDLLVMRLLGEKYRGTAQLKRVRDKVWELTFRSS